MNVQAFQNNLAVVGQTLKNIGQTLVAKLGDLAVRGGQALKQLGQTLIQPFVTLARSLNSRPVTVDQPPQPRHSEEIPDEPENVQTKRETIEDTVLDLLKDHPPMELDYEPDFSDILDGIPERPNDHLGNGSNEQPKVQEQPKVRSKAIDPQPSETFTSRMEVLKNNGMTSGKDAIESSGLVPSHVEQFKQVAKDNNTILMFRPVNPMSTGLLSEGTAAKGLNVHGKSSDWGPMAGYIALDQNLSKKHDDLGAVKKGNEDNHHSLEKDGERISASQLSLSDGRVSYLKEKGLIKSCDENGNLLQQPSEKGTQYFVNGGKNQNYLFKLEPGESGFKVFYKSHGEGNPVDGGRVESWQELKVMGDKQKGGKPLTADYDMFAMMPKMGEGKLIGGDLKPMPKIDSPQVQGLRRDLALAQDKLKQLKENNGEQKEMVLLRREVVKLKVQIGQQQKKDGGGFRGLVNQARQQLLGQSERNEVDPNLGRLTSWQGDLRKDLNKAAEKGGFTGGDIIKHGTEQDNTDFSELDNQVFIITPNGDTFMTSSWEQTQAFMWSAKQDDFLTYTNRSYQGGPEVPQNMVKESTEGPSKENGDKMRPLFYPGQTQDNKFSFKQLSFDMHNAAEKLGLDKIGAQDKN